MPDRIMYVQLKTGFNTDLGPALDQPGPIHPNLADRPLPRTHTPAGDRNRECQLRLELLRRRLR
jgi:hypothetical protein